MHDFHWNDQNTAEVARLWAAGNSASLIAEIIGAPSRNAVMGKIHRLGMQKPVARFGDSAAGGNPKAARASAAARSAGARKPVVSVVQISKELKGGIASSNRHRAGKVDVTLVPTVPRAKAGDEMDKVAVERAAASAHAPDSIELVSRGKDIRELTLGSFPGVASACRPAGNEGVSAEPQPVHFMNLRDRHCRRPLWGDVRAPFPDLFFCGAPALDQSPYCGACRQLLTRPVDRVEA